MSRAWAVWGPAVLALACRGKAPSPVPPPAVEVPSALPAAGSSNLTWHLYGEAVELRQEPTPDGCSVTCMRSSNAVWSRPICLGLVTDFRFVAEDCSAAVVLFEYPRAAEPLEETPAGFVWTAEGAPRPLFLKNFVRNPSMLHRNGAYVSWLAGTVGAPGAPPRKRPTADGIAFEGRDGLAHSLTFATLVATKLPVLASSGWENRGGKVGLYQWEDASGSIQISDYGAIPKDRRARARPISAEISVVKNDNSAAPMRPSSLPHEQTRRFGEPIDLTNPIARQSSSTQNNKSFTELEAEAEADRRRELESDHAAEKAAKERAANPPPPPAFRNSEGENWIEYNNRLVREARGRFR